MLLVHSTDDAGRQGIAATGFGLTWVADSPGASWFASTRREAWIQAGRVGWWVLVDVPDAVAEEHRWRTSDGLRSEWFEVPWRVINQFAPFEFAPMTVAELRGSFDT